MAKKRRKRKNSKLVHSHMRSFRKRNKKSNLLPQDTRFVHQPTDQIKLSEAIQELVALYRHEANTEAAYDKLIGMAVLAWNTTLMSPDKQAESLNFIQNLEDDPEMQKIILEIVQELMVRKLALYPDVDRIIVDYQVTDVGHSFHLSIISSIPEGADLP
ncbi:MAG: hypothetical protein GY796_08880 [Chloroflexi bacterium]|nr:hypothetical protein [Chloroflexota bacterium]